MDQAKFVEDSHSEAFFFKNCRRKILLANLMRLVHLILKYFCELERLMYCHFEIVASLRSRFYHIDTS